MPLFSYLLTIKFKYGIIKRKKDMRNVNGE